MTARMCLAPISWTEITRLLEPVGIDRWPFDLAQKHGMRDGYLCPVGGRWVVGFWGAKGSWLQLHTADPRFALYGRQCGSSSPGAVDWL
jgi:hypothetical protein